MIVETMKPIAFTEEQRRRAVNFVSAGATVRQAAALTGASHAEVTSWVRDMDDATAYMALALNNAQGELSPLEVGLHALHSGKGVREYASAFGKNAGYITTLRQAAEVFAHANIGEALHERTRHLAEIHPAPRWLWPALVAAMVADGWTVEATRNTCAPRVRTCARGHASRSISAA